MTGNHFNIRKGRHRKSRKDDPASSKKAKAPSAGVASPAAALVACIPCPALVVDGERKISALNEPLCDAFAIRSGFYHVGQEFADFARRMSLSGRPGLLALGDLLAGEKTSRSIEIVARNGIVYEARACQTGDNGILITLCEASPSETGETGEQLQNIIKDMPGAMMSVSRQEDGSIRCLAANTMSLELVGMGLREITAPDFDFRKLVAEEEREELDQGLEWCAADGEPFDKELNFETADRGRRRIRCLATISRRADGTSCYFIRMMDVEPRLRVADERQRLQTVLDSVVDNIPFMVNVKAAHDRRFIVVNRAFEEMTGLSRREILGQKKVTVFPEWNMDDRDACYDRLLRTRRPVEIPETTVETPTKGRRILKSRKFPLFDDSGQINHILSITEDVTDRRNAEGALRRSEQRLRDAIESLTDGVALFDADDRLVMCNARYRTMWPGHEPVAVAGTKLEELVRSYFEKAASRDANLDADAEVKKTVERHKLLRSTRDVPIFDGRWFQVSNHPTVDGGFALTCTDITALKEREESLRLASRQAIHAKETAEGANRSKSDFLANMSHELRTPLNAVIGFSEIIKEALLGTDSIDAYRGYAQDIHDSGCHLLSLINDILDMSKIEAGKLELFEEHIDLTEAVEASLRLVSERAQKSRISLSVDIPENLPKLNGDLRKFKQITINLLSNAVKFTQAGGTITTRLFIDDAGDLHLQITDTGIGIRQDQLNKVLEPFGQAEAGLNRPYEGTGLGLTLTKALADLHGARLAITSETSGPDRGTTVTVIFPKSRVVDPG